MAATTQKNNNKLIIVWIQIQNTKKRSQEK